MGLSGGRSVEDEVAATPLWDFKTHVGFYGQVWSGDEMEHYGVFPLTKGQETIEFIKGEIPAARMIVISHRGAMGASVIVDRWAETM
ncbi:hypothetical protein SEA_ZOOMAN_286 [Microbacterium phage Zooman]|nr:hypothetical protein SEA_ZOOMAN_286 [Microbacterium phage Zooman]